MENGKVTDSICLIDAKVFGIPNFTSAYLILGEELALIESGPAKSASLIIEGIRGFGFDPAEVSYIIVTHVHLDHGGGAGTLLRKMPRAKVVVHEKGVKHMLDPSKLVNSSKRVFGNRIDEWYGEVLPVDEDRVVPVKDGDIVDLGKGQRLRMIDSPGHATHHICIYSEKDRGLFTGDAVGVYIPDSRVLIPTTPPPEFDPDVNIETIRGFAGLDLDLLLFSHFGPVDRVSNILGTSIDWLRRWEETVSRMVGGDISLETITEKFRQDTREALGSGEGMEPLHRWVMDYHIPMCASGYLNYFNRKASQACRDS